MSNIEHSIPHSGPIKPWHDPSVDFGPAFWEVARMTPYYEVLLCRIIDYRETKWKQFYSEDKRFVLKFIRKIARCLMPKKSKLRQKAGALYRKLTQR